MRVNCTTYKPGLRVSSLLLISLLIRTQVRGFPKTIETVQDLRDIITRFIFHVSAQHASVNYELSSYAAFVPNMPTKTYKRTNSDDLSFGTLPNKATATVSIKSYLHEMSMSVSDSLISSVNGQASRCQLLLFVWYILVPSSTCSGRVFAATPKQSTHYNPIRKLCAHFVFSVKCVVSMPPTYSLGQKLVANLPSEAPFTLERITPDS